MTNPDVIINKIAQETSASNDERDFKQLGLSEEDIDQKIQFNPIMAYGLFDGSKSGIPLGGKGLREIFRIGTGAYTIVFPSALRSSDYIVLVTPDQERVVWVDAKKKGQFNVTTETNASAAADTNRLNIVVLRHK